MLVTTWHGLQKKIPKLDHRNWLWRWIPYVHNPFNVSINNKTFETVGRINMDAITIDLDGDESIKIGDWVELWGFNTDLKVFHLNLRVFHTVY